MASPQRSNTVIALLVLVLVFLISFSSYYKSPGKTNIFKKMVLETAVPIGGVFRAALGTVGTQWERYVLLVGIKEKNRELAQKVASLTQEVNESREMSLECVRLRKLMEMRSCLAFPSVAARMIGKDRSSVFQTVLIDKGTTDGIEAGAPVVGAGGVVGRIIEVSWNVSKVLLLVDYNSNIDALIQRNRSQGVLQGAGGRGCELKYVQRSDDVREGDIVVSSGLAGVFPKGLLLGTVTGAEKKEADLFQKVMVNPILDITKLEEVLVIVKRPEEDG